MNSVDLTSDQNMEIVGGCVSFLEHQNSLDLGCILRDTAQILTCVGLVQDFRSVLLQPTFDPLNF